MSMVMGAPVVPQQRCFTTQQMTFKASVAGRAAFQPAHRAPQRLRIQTLQIENALSRQGKEETIGKLKPLLEQSSVVVGLRYQGLTVKQIQDFKRSLPKESKLVVCKNTLMRRAANEVEGWSELDIAAKGDNAWLFIPEDVIADSVKAYLGFQEKLLSAIPKEERDKRPRPIDVSGGVMGGKALVYDDVKRLEKLPTKEQLIATIARLIKQVPTRVAVSIKQVPTKVALGVKALADAEEDKSLIVGDVLPKPAAE